MDENRAAARGRTSVAVGATLALFVVCLVYFAPPRVIFSSRPIFTMDFGLHVYQIERAIEAFHGWGKLWGYDPLVLAGQPAGVFEDLTSKGTELFVIGLTRLGFSSGLAFNVFILLVHLAMPAACWASARLFRLDAVESAVLFFSWVLLWFFDSFLHWCWAIGMVTWAAASYWSVVYVGLLYRYLEDRRTTFGLLLAPLGAALLLLHPFVAVSLAAPCVWMYARAFRGLKPAEHAVVWFGAAAALATVLVWIRPFLAFRHYAIDFDIFLRPTVSYAVTDYLDIVQDWINTGSPVRSMLRVLCFAAALIGLLNWLRVHDTRARPLTILIVWTFAWAYLGGHSWYGKQTQPYRHLSIATLAAAVPAAVVLRRLLSPSALRGLPVAARQLLAIAAVLLVPRFAHMVAQYVPELLPARTIRNSEDAASSPLSQLPLEPAPLSTRYVGPDPAMEHVARFLTAHHENWGRVAVTHWLLSEYLAAMTPLPVLGGIIERNILQADAHPLRQHYEHFAGDPIRDYLTRYAVGWVVVDGPPSPIDNRPDLFRSPEFVGAFRLYRTVTEPNYFSSGEGHVVSQGLNSIRIAGAEGSVSLRFHFLETLRCRPDCTVERVSEPHDRVGFIRVPNAPQAFEIYNSYSL